ncbi:hypothetical protein GHT07_05000 [Caenimonas koreensis DSM 17982]|uniref:Uncharacterized protein n=1 Tax=Caenimonas koreensis DSM 17982 TaxID=1121255 RepID=A0A844B0H8_9BURK|nr:hypothetical protein [Caenimonas koreensis]MRD46623.1 hypothetical protein [Caenimonas koreensis DSM 17982]
MIRLTVSVIGVEPTTGAEVVLAKMESRKYDPDHAERQVGSALEAALKAAKTETHAALRAWKPEVAISLIVEEELVRPALHLGDKTLALLSLAGASVDFDPYVD